MEQRIVLSLVSELHTSIAGETTASTRSKIRLIWVCVQNYENIAFNNLPHEIKDLANDILPFQNALKRFLLANSFYNSKEYSNYRGRFIEI